MKHINFIEPSTRHDRSVYQWFRMTGIFIGAVIIIGLFINAGQLITIYVLHTQPREMILVPPTTSLAELEATYTRVTTLYETIEKKRTGPRTPWPIIEYVHTHAGDITISSIQCMKHATYTIDGTAPSVNHVMEFVQSLKSSPLFTNVTLQSLQQTSDTTNPLHFSIQGNYKLNM